MVNANSKKGTVIGSKYLTFCTRAIQLTSADSFQHLWHITTVQRRKK